MVGWRRFRKRCAGVTYILGCEMGCERVCPRTSNVSRAAWLHEQSELVGLLADVWHALDNPRQHGSIAQCHRQRIVQRVVVPIHLRQSQNLPNTPIPATVSSEPLQQQRMRNVLSLFE